MKPRGEVSHTSYSAITPLINLQWFGDESIKVIQPSAAKPVPHNPIQ